MINTSESGATTDLWWMKEGSGLPMLMLHGGMGLDHTYLTHSLRPLATRLQLIYLDHRGNGRSPEPSDWDDISHESWVDDAERLRHSLGYEKIILFGHSYGGIVAQEYALKYPDRVHALILCSTFPAFDFAEQIIPRAQARATQKQFDGLLAGLSAPFTSDTAFSEFVSLVQPLYFHNPDPAFLAEFNEVKLRAAAFNHSNRKLLPSFSIISELGRISAPTLILNGADDWSAPLPPTAERLHANIPNSSLVILERSGHYPFMEEPQRFVESVATWLDAVIDPGRHRIL